MVIILGVNQTLGSTIWILQNTLHESSSETFTFPFPQLHMLDLLPHQSLLASEKHSAHRDEEPNSPSAPFLS